MPLLQVKANEEVLRPAQTPEITSNFTTDAASIEGAEAGNLAWMDLEPALTDEWEIGGLAMPTDAIRALIAGE